MKIAEYLESYGELEPEYLLAAILNPKHTRADKYFQEIGITQNQLTDELLETLGNYWRGENLKKWQNVLNDTFLDITEISNTSSNSVELNEPSEKRSLPKLINAHYSSDSPDADDLMDVEDEARSFSRYISKSDLTTPLSIGLFGDWGSGKTFFMHKMMKFVEELQQQGKTDKGASRSRSWCSNIIQIEFNAWHYIESNLWASLVEHILNEMDQWLKKENKESTINKLYKEFETVQEVEREFKDRLERAVSSKKVAQIQYDEAKGEYKRAIEDQKKITAQDIWSSVTQAFKDNLQNDETLKRNIDIASIELGVEELQNSAKKLNEVVNQAQDISGRSRILLSSLVTKNRGFFGYVFLVLLLASVPIGVNFIWNILASAQGLLEIISSGIIELSALITVVAGWGSIGIHSANKALMVLENANESLKVIIHKKVEKQKNELDLAELVVSSSEQKVSQISKQLSKAKQDVEKATLDLKAQTPRARLTKFLQDRLDNSNYSNHLGIVSMIRKDFDFLSRIMTGEDWTDEEKEKLKIAGIRIEDEKPFERIILYIDDLDRCPEDRVVEVLQAVHLLLAFPLFVVVVGVDARWVSRALSMSYKHLLGDTISPDIENSSKVIPDGQPKPKMNNEKEFLRISKPIASSRDYLEKIFQIPYWVKPMDTISSQGFIEKLARSSQVKSRNNEVLNSIVNDFKDEARKSGINTSNNKNDIDEIDTKLTDKSKKLRAAVSGTTEYKEELSETLFSQDLTLVELALTDYEIDFMTLLAPYIGYSPRRAKRFFNVYQLVRAGLSVDERENFVGEKGESADYRVMMCLLAIVTGSPILAPHFFSEVVDVYENDSGPLSRLIDKITKDEVFFQSSEWPRLSGALLNLRGVGTETETIKKIRYWTRRAMRFSFTARPV